MAEAEGEVLQLTMRPWDEVSRVRLPAGEVAPDEEAAAPAADATGCNFWPKLCVAGSSGSAYSDCVVALEGGMSLAAHRVFLPEGATTEAAAFWSYGNDGAASRARAREVVLEAFETKAWCDCVVICGTARERAHRCVLAAQSAFCRAETSRSV